MFEDEWPWPGISRDSVSKLPTLVLEDIGDYIEMKLAKHSRDSGDGKTELGS